MVEMEEATEGVKIAGKTLNNRRYADDMRICGARWLRGSVVDRGSIGPEYEPRLGESEPLRRDLEQVLYSHCTLTALRRETPTQCPRCVGSASE